MVARKAVTRSGRGMRGYFPSQKMGRMVAWESVLERDAILLFEFSPGVARYQSQPELVFYPDSDGSVLRKYFPDFAVTLGDGAEIQIEVKPSSKLIRQKDADKYRAIAAHYQAQSRRYRILTELEIRREPLHANLKNLARHTRPSETLEAAQRQVRLLLRNGPLPMNALGQDTTTAWRLLAYGYLRCDLAAPITASTLFSLPGGDGDDSLLF